MGSGGKETSDEVRDRISCGSSMQACSFHLFFVFLLAEASSPILRLIPVSSFCSLSHMPAASASPPRGTPQPSWRSPLLSLQSAAFGVAGSGVAKLALTDEWTNFFVDAAYEGTRWIIQSAALSSDDADAESDDAVAPVSSIADPLSLLAPRRVHVFYFVRVSLLLLKLYLDSRMLGFFVRSMHASSSLMASTYNQCAAIILAVNRLDSSSRSSRSCPRGSWRCCAYC
jgi:hypothetical protein